MTVLDLIIFIGIMFFILSGVYLLIGSFDVEDANLSSAAFLGGLLFILLAVALASETIIKDWFFSFLNYKLF